MPICSRVLIVDDSAPFRRELRKALEASGMQVWEASEGLEALWRVRNERPFEILVVDVHMPTMDGLAFIHEVRSVPGYERTPIVVVTSDASRERRQAGRELGVTAWLLKPPETSAMVKGILAALYRNTKPNDDEGSQEAG